MNLGIKGLGFGFAAAAATFIGRSLLLKNRSKKMSGGPSDPHTGIRIELHEAEEARKS